MVRGLPIVLAGLLVLPAVAARQNTAVQWLMNVEQGVARSKQTQRPLMFWVLGRSDSRDPSVERAQKRAFRNSLVVELSSRFVPVKLSRSRYRDLLEKWNVSPRANLEIVFVAPTGDKIDTLSSLGAADAEVLARKMTLIFRHYRQRVFEHQIKPKLEGEESTDQQLRAALRLIAEFVIMSADQSVVEFLKREDLSAAVQAEAYGALAELSTPLGVTTLLEQAPEDKQAAAALSRCTPDAAERMLPMLEGEDPDLKPIVYGAVTKICGIRDVKPDRFWQGRIALVKKKEVDRVRRIVTAAAERWRERYAEYR